MLAGASSMGSAGTSGCTISDGSGGRGAAAGSDAEFGVSGPGNTAVGGAGAALRAGGATGAGGAGSSIIADGPHVIFDPLVSAGIGGEFGTTGATNTVASRPGTNPPYISGLSEDLGDTNWHHVLVAGNGEEATELYKQMQFDLVLMDMHMPDMGPRFS